MNISDLVTVSNFIKLLVAAFIVIAIIILLSTNNWNIKQTVLSILSSEQKDKV